MLNTYDDGYKLWCSFVKEIYQNNLIPIIHFNEESPEKDNNKQVEKLSDISNVLAFRLDADDISPLDSFKNLNQAGAPNIIYILDVGFVSNTDFSPTIIDNINTLSKQYNPYKIFITSSSFPKSVTEVGDENQGVADLIEVQVFNKIASKVEGGKVSYGDYACIHPIRIEQAGGRGWYPRIDYPLDNFWFYHRKPFNKGDRNYTTGYIDVANSVIKNDAYKPIEGEECWGDDEIIAAADGSPNGRSPVYWIAVRANIHITRQCGRLY